MRINKRIVFAIVAVTVVVLGTAVLLWPRAPAGYSGKTESIIFGGLVSDANTMLFTAEDQYFFAANGINFTFRTYGTGVDTINDLLNNKLDIASAAEYPIVAKAFERADVSIITSISKSYNVHLIGLADKGIRSVADVKGKRIGLPPGAIPGFYLSRFLNLNGMSIRDVTLINLSPAQAADAIAYGRVDAVVTWDPYASRIREQYANGTVSWSVHSGQAVYGVLMCRNDWIRQNPDLVRRFLKSLAQAERYIVQHPTDAKAILKNRYKYDDAYVDRIWKEHQFFLSLDQSLIVAMEDEARWMINNNLTREKTIPDFTEYIYSDGLKAVKPEAVNIIH